MKTISEILSKLKEVGKYVIDTDSKEVLTREQLGETISSDYEGAIKALDSGEFAETFKIVDKEMSHKLTDLENKLSSSSQIIFHLQYVLNPNLPFSYKDVIYRDVNTMGEAMLKNKAEKETLMEAVKLKLVTHYARFKELNLIRSDIIDNLEFAENYYANNPEIAYYLIAYYLADRKYYKYDGRKFLSIVSLYTYLSDKKKLARFSTTMEQDILFIAWVYALGNSEIYEKWVDEVNKIEELDYSNYVNEPVKQQVYTPKQEKIVKKKAKQPKGSKGKSASIEKVATEKK